MNPAIYIFILQIHSTLPKTKKYVEIFLQYRWLFIKGAIIVGEWEMVGTEVFLHYSQCFVKGNFGLGRTECKHANEAKPAEAPALQAQLSLNKQAMDCLVILFCTVHAINIQG